MIEVCIRRSKVRDISNQSNLKTQTIFCFSRHMQTHYPPLVCGVECVSSRFEYLSKFWYKHLNLIFSSPGYLNLGVIYFTTITFYLNSVYLNNFGATNGLTLISPNATETLRTCPECPPPRRRKRKTNECICLD